jgi:hypothetical protein
MPSPWARALLTCNACDVRQALPRNAAGYCGPCLDESHAAEPRPFGELLRAGFCRHCGEPIRLVDDTGWHHPKEA